LILANWKTKQLSRYYNESGVEENQINQSKQKVVQIGSVETRLDIYSYSVCVGKKV
jgi:hypothetical protein